MQEQRCTHPQRQLLVMRLLKFPQWRLHGLTYTGKGRSMVARPPNLCHQYPPSICTSTWSRVLHGACENNTLQSLLRVDVLLCEGGQWYGTSSAPRQQPPQAQPPHFRNSMVVLQQQPQFLQGRSTYSLLQVCQRKVLHPGHQQF
jgi:hypothetical protein